MEEIVHDYGQETKNVSFEIEADKEDVAPPDEVEQVVQEPEDPPVPGPNSILKAKRPRSVKQREAFERCQAARKAKIAERKQSKGSKKPAKHQKKPSVVYVPEPTEPQSESDDEEHVVYVPKPARRKKKKVKRTRVVYVSDSESDGYESDNYEGDRGRSADPVYDMGNYYRFV